MKIVTLLFSSLLSWAAFDVNLFRRGRGRGHSPASTSFSYEESERQQKKIRKLRPTPMRKWHLLARAPVRSKVNFHRNDSRDPRDSNQRKIRRKFNNM